MFFKSVKGVRKQGSVWKSPLLPTAHFSSAETTHTGLHTRMFSLTSNHLQTHTHTHTGDEAVKGQWDAQL